MDELDRALLENRLYPDPEDEGFQNKIYVKRDFHSHKTPIREKIKDEDRLEEYMKKCNTSNKLSDAQAIVTKFINPNTQFRALLYLWGTGSGKTIGAIAVAETFKEQVVRYDTKIYVIVSGPLLRENFINEIIKYTGNLYIKGTTTRAEVVQNISAYYSIMSYTSFVNRIIGEEEGSLSTNRITNLDNTLLIVDEAHNLTDNTRGKAVSHITKASKNLRVLLLSATPMKNSADDIVELINYMRPASSQMKKDKIFTKSDDGKLEFKPGGIDYLRKMTKGYVSYLRGADPLTYAEALEMGDIPKELDFTKLTLCNMEPFQRDAYVRAMRESGDNFERETGAAGMFCFPGLDRDEKTIIPFYGVSGIQQIKLQLHKFPKKLNDAIEAKWGIKNGLALRNGDNLAGEIFSLKNLKHFSAKFHRAFSDISKTYRKGENDDHIGEGLGFIYSTLVQAGVDIIQAALIQNGFLEHQEQGNYQIRDNTLCYLCGHPKSAHPVAGQQKHTFHPATFIIVTGGGEDGSISQEKYDVITKVFNSNENKNGRYAKLLVGSSVMKEGVTLKNQKYQYHMDFHFVLGGIDQIKGRSVRYCVHALDMKSGNLYPQVQIHKYAVSLPDATSAEIDTYRKAEIKYRMIKQVERVLMEEAIDCPLNRGANIFPEELEKYRDCEKTGDCPAVCGYASCNYICSDKILNAKYYDPESNAYRFLEKSELDYSTYDVDQSVDEIRLAGDYVKKLFATHYVYTLRAILDGVKKRYPIHKRKLFDPYYVYQALNELTPITPNDFNNLDYSLKDKYDRPGYLIYVGSFYIFQPINEPDNLPARERDKYVPVLKNRESMREYLEKNKIFEKYNTKTHGYNKKVKEYEYASTMRYYESRQEFDYVCIIDSKKTSATDEGVDELKVRIKRPDVIEKKRQAGVPSFMGSVCGNSKSIDFLIKMGKALGLKLEKDDPRTNLCQEIRDRATALEKYSTSADKNKFTYLIVPSNHEYLPFPLNLEDRAKKITSVLNKSLSPSEFSIVKNPTKGKYQDIKAYQFVIQVKTIPETLANLSWEKSGSGYRLILQ